MVNIDPENEEHMTVMSRVFGLPRSTLRMHMKTVRGILAAWEEVNSDEAEVKREDKYRISIGGFSFAANEQQEAAIRSMTVEERINFARMLGKE